MAAHSSILGWIIAWTEEPGGFMELQRVGHHWVTGHARTVMEWILVTPSNSYVETFLPNVIIFLLCAHSAISLRLHLYVSKKVPFSWKSTVWSLPGSLAQPVSRSLNRSHWARPHPCIGTPAPRRCCWSYSRSWVHFSWWARLRSWQFSRCWCNG